MSLFKGQKVYLGLHSLDTVLPVDLFQKAFPDLGILFKKMKFTQFKVARDFIQKESTSTK